MRRAPRAPASAVAGAALAGSADPERLSSPSPMTTNRPRSWNSASDDLHASDASYGPRARSVALDSRAPRARAAARRPHRDEPLPVPPHRKRATRSPPRHPAPPVPPSSMATAPSSLSTIMPARSARLQQAHAPIYPRTTRAMPRLRRSEDDAKRPPQRARSPQLPHSSRYAFFQSEIDACANGWSSGARTHSGVL